MNIPNKQQNTSSFNPNSQQIYKPGKTFLAQAPTSLNIVNQKNQQQPYNRAQSQFERNQADLTTPKPQQQSYINQKNKSMINPEPLYPRQNQVLVSPAFATAFSKDRSHLKQKRGYSEMSQNDDKSTIKPELNTIVRNPTMLSMGIGQEGSQRINKSHMIHPTNLNRTNFHNIEQQDDVGISAIQEGDEDNFYQFSNFQLNAQLNDKPQYSSQYTKKTYEYYDKKEINNMCESASMLINQIAEMEANPFKNDISQVNSKGLHYEFCPFQYIVTNQYKVPNQILTVMQDARLNQNQNTYTDSGIFEDLQVAYYVLNNVLYLWSYSFGVGLDGVMNRSNIVGDPQILMHDQIVTAVQICHPLPEMQKLQPDDRILVVATCADIQIYIISRHERTGALTILKTDYQIPTDNNLIYKIAQFKKNGRIFYGGQDGHVNEINLKQNTVDTIISLVNPNRKKLKKKDLQQDSIITRFIPNFFKGEYKKSIKEIKFDQTRNYLYTLSISLEERTQNQAIIEVFDLGILGNEFKRIVTINQYQIVEGLYDYQDIQFRNKGHDIFEISNGYNIVFMQPILFNESQQNHLLVVTQQGIRMYISFEEMIYNKDITEEDLEKPDAILDFEVQNRFTHKWYINQVLDLPNENQVEEQLDASVQQGVFKVYNIATQAQKQTLDSESICYDNTQSMFVFSVNNSLQQLEYDPDYPPNIQTLNLNFVKKNESTYAHFKHTSDQVTMKNYEQYSHVKVVVAVPRINHHHQQSMMFDENITQNEIIFDIKTLNSYPHRETLKLLGLNKTYQDYKGHLVTQIYPYQSIGDLERQVHLSSLRVQILTNQRVLEIQQLRPIDQLAMILHSQSKPVADIIGDLEDFMDLYTVKETCAMLVQIISDPTATYLFSKRLENQIGISRSKNKRNAISQPRQMRSNIGGGISKSSMYQSPFHGGINRQSQYSSQMIDNRSTLNLIKFQDKHYALYLYLQRIIRPFWDMKVVYPIKQGYSTIYQPTLDSLTLVQQKLEGLYTFIAQNYSQFCGETKKIFNIPFGDTTGQGMYIQNQCIYDQVSLVESLPYKEKEYLEQMERNSLNNIKLLIVRTIEVINLLEIVTFDNDPKMFAKLWKKLSKSHQQELIVLCFRDLVNTSHNQLIRKLLEATIDIDQQPDSGRTAQIIRERSIRVNKLCNALFTTEENKAFVGERILSTALKEKDLRKREELFKQGIMQISQEPLEIDLNVLAPLLIENGNFTSLVDMSLRKINALEKLGEVQKKKLTDEEINKLKNECYELISNLFSALDIKINNQIKEFSQFYSSEKDKVQLKLFLKKLNQIGSIEIVINIRNRIMMQIEQYNDQYLLTGIFNYLISKPQDTFNSNDDLPQISKEAFDILLNDMMKDESIQRHKFDYIIKMLAKQSEVEKLCTLIINVCSQKQSLNEIVIDQKGQEKEEEYDLTMAERESYLQKADIVLYDRKREMNVDLHTKLYQEISKLNQVVKLQLYIQRAIDNKIVGLKEHIAFNNENNQDQLNEDLLAKIEELQNMRYHLDSNLYERDGLLKDFIEKGQIYQAKLFLYLQEDVLQSQRNNTNTNINDALNQFIKDVMNNYKKSYQKVLKDMTTLFNNQLAQLYLKTYFQLIFKESLIRFRNFNRNNENKSIKEILQKLYSDQNLYSTPYWIIQYAFEESNHKLIPSEIVNWFSDDRFKTELPEDPNGIVKYLCIFKLWTDKNKRLFGTTDNLIQSPSKNLIYSDDPKAIFNRDLIQNGIRIYKEFMLDGIEAHYNQIHTIIEKELNIQVQQMIKTVEVRFQQMLKQHQIQTDNLKFHNQLDSQKVVINNPQYTVKQLQSKFVVPTNRPITTLAQNQVEEQKQPLIQRQPPSFLNQSQQIINQSFQRVSQGSQPRQQLQSPNFLKDESSISLRGSNPPGTVLQTSTKDFSLGRSNITNQNNK